MKSNPYLLRLLNVRASEWSLVQVLFIYEFLQGAGIAFFFTASISLFLDEFSVEKLPYVFIIASFLLWIFGFIYSKLEARLKITTLARVITIFMAVSFLLFRLAIDYLPHNFFFLMLAFYNVLYLLNNLEFWGISSLLFDVRQSKRLFGIISAGDIPAKFIGYSLALILVSYLGTANLLYAGVVCMLASLPFLGRIQQAEDLKKHDAHHGHHHGHKHHKQQHGHAHLARNAAHQVSHLVKNFTVNALIRRIAAVTVIASAVFIVANFAFYAKVKEAFTTDVGLAQFIALFFAIVRVAAMIIKMVFTGRLINQLGTIKSLMITPVLMILLVISVLLLEYYSSGHAAILYLFGVMAIFVDILRTAINTPVFLTLMQPLSTHERLRAHTITKGIMDPFAYLFTGLMLLGVLEFEHSVHIETLNMILLVLGTLWIIGIYRINSQYLKTLLKTIGNRFFNNSEFSLNDSFTLNWLKQKLSQGDETEAANILKMVAINQSVVASEIILSGLNHPSEKIRSQVIQLAGQRNVPIPEHQLKELLQHAETSALKAELIRELSRLKVNENEILGYTMHRDRDIQKAAISGIIRNGTWGARRKMRELIQMMVRSDERKMRNRAAGILFELQDAEFKEEIRLLMKDSDGEVKRQAYLAASHTGDSDLIAYVLQQLRKEEKLVLEALFVSGEKCLDILRDHVLHMKATPGQVEKLVRLTGRIGGEKAHEILVVMMQELPWTPGSIFKTLYLSGFKALLHQSVLFEQHIRKTLEQAAGILYMQKLLFPMKLQYKELSNSLELEIHSLRDTLLYIFAIIYDRDQIRDVRAAFLSGSKESVANAMEIVEMTVKKEFAICFNTIFEQADITEKVYALKKMFPEKLFRDIEMILAVILKQDEFRYDKWTTACSIYTTKKHHHRIDNELICKYIEDEHPLLSELAKDYT